MNKEAEKKRLAKEVFEGAPPEYGWAAMDASKVFCLYKRKPYKITGSWTWTHADPEIPQHKPWIKSDIKVETTLDWRDSLIRIEDYE